MTASVKQPMRPGLRLPEGLALAWLTLALLGFAALVVPRVSTEIRTAVRAVSLPFQPAPAEAAPSAAVAPAAQEIGANLYLPVTRGGSGAVPPPVRVDRRSHPAAPEPAGPLDPKQNVPILPAGLAVPAPFEAPTPPRAGPILGAETVRRQAIVTESARPAIARPTDDRASPGPAPGADLAGLPRVPGAPPRAGPGIVTL